MIVASAPGKAVLSGEYAVLEGAAAIAVAVNRRARVKITQSADDCHVITAPGYLSGKWYFGVDRSGNFAWREALPDASAFALVEAVWNSLGNTRWPPLSLEIDTSELCDNATGLKLGLGSSAAVAVALTAALKNYCDIDRDVGPAAFSAHQLFQRLRGSGIDVAASHEGGLILYRRAVEKSDRHDAPARQARQSTGRSIRRLGWPEGLRYRFLWSGQAADTAGKLAQLGGGAHSDAVHRLAEPAEDVAAAWSRGDPREILESYPAYIDALERFSSVNDLGIFDAGHAGLVNAAADTEVVYKPCGAGGGDIGIVLGACEHDVKEFCEQASRHKFTVLDLAVDEQGILFAE